MVTIKNIFFGILAPNKIVFGSTTVYMIFYLDSGRAAPGGPNSEHALSRESKPERTLGVHGLGSPEALPDLLWVEIGP